MATIKLECPNHRVFGFAHDATGTLQVTCTASRCKRHGEVHLFNLANGLCVSEPEPTDGSYVREETTEWQDLLRSSKA